MKPIKLEIQAFGPFVEKQVVDFERLSGDGLFLIRGITGSGKTTIFDAMTFALYGGSSGTDEKSKTGRNDFEEWRCTQAAPSTPTEVSFTFLSRGHVYRFTRRLEMKRKNLNEVLEAGEIDEAGNEHPFFSNPKKAELLKKAEELVGLNKEQFRQVVLLPQGQFERFLTAGSEEKETILRKIFHTEKWGSYANAFYSEAENTLKALRAERDAVKLKLTELGTDSLEGLDALAQEKKTKLDETEAAHLAFSGEEKQRALNADISLSERFEALHALEKKQEQLHGRAEEIGEKRSRYALAEQAEGVRRPIETCHEAEKDREGRSADLEELRAALPDREREAAEAAKTLAAHAESSPVAELQGKIGEYESKREAYASVGALRESLAAAEREAKDAEAARSRAEAANTAAVKEAAKAMKAYEDADTEAKNARSRYFAGIYGELASALEEGERCPVCGSTDHPDPAEKTSDSVSREDMEEAEERAEKKKNAWNAAEKKREQAAEAAEREKAAAAEAAAKKSAAEATVMTAAAALIEGIPDTAALDQAVRKLKRQISDFERKTEELKRESEEAERAVNTLRANIDSASAELEKAESRLADALAELEAALRENGYADAAEAERRFLPAEKRTRLHREIVEYDTAVTENERSLAEKREELADSEEPDKTLFARRQSDITGEQTRYSREKTQLELERDTMLKARTELADKEEHYRKHIARAESDFNYARQIRGDRGMSLQRYVLAVMFNQVITEANQMLQKVHGGRYSLFRTDEKGSGNKTGLELKVLDSRSPENEGGRSVATLSGGEKFLVSLALSIGMSATAQKSGAEIDALFIDEGFGTLDEKSISDAMNVLQFVRQGRGTIGIISHVSLLEDTISTQLEVVKEAEGSHIRYV